MTDHGGVRTPVIPLGTNLGEFIGHEIVGTKRSIRRFSHASVLGAIEAVANSFTVGGGVIFTTLSQALANLNYAANQMAWVIQDATPANNGVYQKTGSSGSGSWSRLGDLPYSFYRAVNEGAGTANAIKATNDYPLASKDSLIVVNIIDTNTASPVTLSLNGATPLTIKTASGNDPAIGGLVADMVMAGYIDQSGTQFRLLSDQASAAIVPAAEAALAGTIAAKSDAQDAADAAIGATGIAQFATKSAAEATTIPASTKHLSLAGYTTPGIGPWQVAVRVSSEPSHQGKLRSTDRFMPDGSTDSEDGGWWEIKETLVTPLMFGATGDGSTNDSAAVQAACDYPYANEVRFPGVSANYKIATQIELTSVHNGKRFSGNGILKQPAADQHIFNCTSCTGLDFDGLQFVGRVTVSSGHSPTTSHNNAITLTTCTDITVQNCKCSRFEFMFVKDFGGKKIRIINNDIFENSFGGQFTGTKNLTISGNSWKDGLMYSTTPTTSQFCTVWTLDGTEGHSWGYCVDVVMTGNRILNAGYSQAFLCHAGINISITGNLTENCSMGISCNPFNATDVLSGVSITGNTLIGAVGYTLPTESDVGINVNSASPSPDPTNVSISGNNVSAFNRSSFDISLGGIKIAASNGVSVSGNTVAGCAGSGIIAYDCEALSIVGNSVLGVVSATGTRNGITFMAVASTGTCIGNSIDGAGVGINYLATGSMVQANNRVTNTSTATSGTPGGTGV